MRLYRLGRGRINVSCLKKGCNALDDFPSADVGGTDKELLMFEEFLVDNNFSRSLIDIKKISQRKDGKNIYLKTFFMEKEDVALFKKLYKNFKESYYISKKDNTVRSENFSVYFMGSYVNNEKRVFTFIVSTDGINRLRKTNENESEYILSKLKDDKIDENVIAKTYFDMIV